MWIVFSGGTEGDQFCASVIEFFFARCTLDSTEVFAGCVSINGVSYGIIGGFPFGRIGNVDGAIWFILNKERIT